MSRWFMTVLCGLVLSLSARAGNPPPTQLFYVPFPEDNQLAGFLSITAGNGTTQASDPMAVFVTFSAATNDTVIYYDHWEDGYERDITNPTQSTTLVFGDGNAANGYPPGNASDLIPAGTVFSLRNYVNSTSLQSVLDYDARDKVASYKPISLTKTIFPASTNTLLGGCVEVFEKGLWGTEYRVPVGTNMPTSAAASPLTWDYDIFNYTALSVMAGANGATVQIDADNNGAFESTVTLAEGETSYVTNVLTGGRVVSDNPVQVVMFTGRPTSKYQSRDTSLLPTYRWSSSYYAPVSTSATYGTAVFLYNPGASAITVNYDYRSSASSYVNASVSVPAGGNARVNLSPSDNSTNFGAYHFYTTGGTPPVFYAFCAVDANSSTLTNNQAYDGGFTLVGQPSLTTQVLVSLGIGRDPYSSVSPTQNGNPVWLTTVGNGHTQETVYIDYNGDNAGTVLDPNGNHCDLAVPLRELEQLKIFDPDGDQSGLLVYTLNSTVKVAAAWAQDPGFATDSQPGLDVSTLLPPLREGEAGKKSNLATDADGDGEVSAGDTLEYDIRAANSARAAIPGPFAVQDNLPANVNYVAGSTRYRFSVNGSWQAWVAIPDNGSGTAFPLDGSGCSVPGSLGKGQQLQVIFNATIKDYPDLSGNTVINTGFVEISPYGLVLPIDWTDVIYGSIGDRIWSDLDGDGVQDPGEPGIAGIDVFADTNNNGIRDSGEPNDVTDSNGEYLLAGLTTGTYTVRVDIADISAINVGYGPTFDLDGLATLNSASVTLAGAQDRVDADFGYRIGASVGDRVWMDRDADGVQEDGEPGMFGVRVYLDIDNDNTFDAGEPNALTSIDGVYFIGNLNSGTYAVRVDTTTLPSGAIQTYDLNGGPDHEASVTLLAAEHRGDLDFGYRGVLSIGDLVWEDANGNGSPATSTIYNVNNGRIDVNGDGSYNTNDDGFIGTMRIVDGYADIDNDSSTPVDTGDDGTFLGINIVDGGFDMNNSGTISTTGSNDDGQATYNSSEAGIANVRVFVDMDNDGLFDVSEPSAVTNASGGYSITNLFDGTFAVRVDTATLPSSYVQTYDLSSPLADHAATVVLSGASRTDVDFGYRNDASIGDLIWNDRDADGVRDAGEPGIEGVIVYIDADNDNIFDQGLERFDITDVNGSYLLDNLAAGTYAVRVEFSTLPQGCTQTYDLDATLDHESSRTLATSENATNVDFGYRASASAGDFVWNDVDADGIQDGGESGINGVRVYLDTNGDGAFDSATEPSAVTNASGAYSIGNLLPGTYTARIDLTTLPAGSAQTYDLVGGLDHAATFSLSATQARADIDFGYTQQITIGNYVWNDLDADGQQDGGESGLDGVTVTLFNAANDTIVGTTVTAGGGAYEFVVMPGTYYVVFGTPAGYNPSLADQGVDTTDSDAAISTGRTPNVTISGGQSDLTIDAGFYQPGAIGDFVWNDANANGQQDGGETGLDGVAVTLYRPGYGPDGIAGNADDATAVATTTTGGGGAYSFANLRPGTYQANFGSLAGYNRTLATQGAGSSDSDANAGTGTTENFVVTAGAANATVDAGYYQPVTIGDFVWNDANANGQQDGGDLGINGVTVTLYRPGFGADGIAGNADDAVAVTTTTTSGGGAYTFTGLRPGTYQVNFGTLAGYNRTLVDQGVEPTDSDANASTGQTGNIVLAAGASDTTIDAGYYQPASIADFVWNDSNANGQQDVGELGMNGVAVTLFRPGFGADGIAGTADDALAVTSTTTSGGGAYSFANLRPGTYRVTFGAVAGYNRTLANQGSDNTDSDANVGTGQTANIVLAAGVSNTITDAGYYQPTSVGDFVWNDANANGQQDGGEPGINGVTVTLYRPGFGADGIAGNADDAVAVSTTTTAGGGAYSFTNLRPGTYQINFGALAGYNRTLADRGADSSDSDANDSTGQTGSFALAAGVPNTTVDAAYYQPSSIGDLVWNDSNANGQQDGGEPGIDGVTVTLYRPGFGADGIAGNPDDALAVTSTTTSGGGAYSFTNLRPGSYQIGFGPVAGSNRTLADQGADATDSDVSPGTGLTGTFAVAAGVTETTIDAGYYQPASIGDFVWNDANANGRQDGGEFGINGVTVTLYRPGYGADGIAGNADDALAVATATTSGGGAYAFGNLRPGTYQINFGALAGYSRTLADQGADSTDSDADPGTGQTGNIVLSPGEANTSADAGFYQPAAIGDFVWNDADADGQQDGGESGINGVTVTLYRPGFGADGIAGNTDDALAVTSTITSGGGAYSFAGLPPGTYQINFGTLGGYSRSLSDQGADAGDSDADPGTGQTGNIVLAAGVPNATVDAAYYQPASIGDFVWNDTNANGHQDGGEPGLNGVSVTLYRPGFGPDGIAGNADDSTSVATTTTAGGGAYGFTGLRPGTYQVQFGTLSGYSRTLVDQGADSADSDANFATGFTTTFSIAVGATNNTIDAGFYQPGIVSGHLYIDTNGDGNQDVGEPDLANVNVIVTDVNGNTQAISTDSSGNWSATVPPGSTIADVDETDPQYPTGYTRTEGDDPTTVTAVSATTVSAGNDGYFLPGVITGFVLADTNNDNSGDSGIAGVTLTLVDASGNPVDGDPNTSGVQTITTTTGSNGGYTFGNLPPGTYGVLETQPSGFRSVSDKDGGDLDEIRPVTVIAGVTNTGNNFIEEQPGSISGTVLEDTDGDNDGDDPLSGVVIHLLNSSGNPVLDGFGQPVTTTTDVNGQYAFVGLDPGDYCVSEDQPSNYNSVSDTDGPNDNVIGNVTPITVVAGQNNSGNHFVEIELGVISGYVLTDVDNNGSGDTGLGGVVLNLLDGSGSPVLDGLGAPIQVSTNASGFYQFTLVPVGTYRVSQNQPAGYGSVSDVDGANNNLIGDQTPIVMTPGLVVANRNFVEIEFGSIAGSVLRDVDDNGSGDGPLAGVTLTLLDGSGNPVDGDANTPGVQSVTTTTDSLGGYRFDNLFPGSYQVSETQPSGYGSVSDVDGGNPDRIGNITAITVAPGQDVTGRDFIEIELGSISGYVYAGATPLSGVTLTLLDGNGDPVDGDPNTPGVQPVTTVTDSLGHYTFNGVVPGTYQVGQSQPLGYNSFGDADGGDYDIIGDITPITLLPGQHSQNNNFIETLDTCPDDWAQWKFMHPGEQASGNPDADSYDNLAEFAFAMPAEDGTGSGWLGSTAWIIRPSTLAPGTLEGVFIRPKGAPLNVTYSLQYAASPGNPTVWQSIVITPSMITTMDNGDCTETVTIHDLETVTGLTGGSGTVRIKADLDEVPSTGTDHTSFSEVEGWKETPLELCCRTYNNPYLRETAFTGTVSAVSGQNLTFAVSAGSADLSTLLTGGSFYLEVTSGVNEGHRFDIISASGNTVTLANDAVLDSTVAPFNTRVGAPPASLVNDVVSIRRHWTLAEVFPPAGFGATGSQSTADQIQVFAGGAWTIYWLYDENDGNPATAHWVDAADVGMADQGATVLPPGQGVFFNNRGSATSVLAYGEIRPNDFIRPLAAGSNLVGGGYPIHQSATGSGSRAMNPGTGFFGSRDFKTADSFFVWNADNNPTAGGYNTYFLLSGAPTQPSIVRWVKTGDALLQARDSDLLLQGNRSVFVRAKNALNSYTIPSPWNP